MDRHNQPSPSLKKAGMYQVPKPLQRPRKFKITSILNSQSTTLSEIKQSLQSKDVGDLSLHSSLQTALQDVQNTRHTYTNRNNKGTRSQSRQVQQPQGDVSIEPNIETNDLQIQTLTYRLKAPQRTARSSSNVKNSQFKFQLYPCPSTNLTARNLQISENQYSYCKTQGNQNYDDYLFQQTFGKMKGKKDQNPQEQNDQKQKQAISDIYAKLRSVIFL